MSDYEEFTVTRTLKRFRLKTPFFMSDLAKAEVAAARAWWEGHGARSIMGSHVPGRPMENLPDDALTYLTHDEYVVIEVQYEQPQESTVIPGQRS